MATVYLADDLRHERRVALKVLRPELAAVVGAERHILPLHDSGEADGFLYYVMPYIEGETLRDRLEREKELPVEEAVSITSDVAEALHAAHEQAGSLEPHAIDSPPPSAKNATRQGNERTWLGGHESINGLELSKGWLS